MRRAFVDTSAWIAAGLRAQAGHAAVRGALQEWEGRLVTSDQVFGEAVTLARRRCGHSASARLGRLLRSAAAVDLVAVTAEDREDAWTFFLQQKDKGFSFTDCTSFAVMRRLRLQVAITTDARFSQAGFDVWPALG